MAREVNQLREPLELPYHIPLERTTLQDPNPIVISLLFRSFYDEFAKKYCLSIVLKYAVD